MRRVGTVRVVVREEHSVRRTSDDEIEEIFAIHDLETLGLPRQIRKLSSSYRCPPIGYDDWVQRH